VSGHASAGELIYCYNLVKPRHVMPVHGEPRHLRANAELAMLTGVPADRVVMAEDGIVVDLVDGSARIAGSVPCGYVYVDGLSVGDVTEASLKDRRILGEEGFVSVFVVIDASTGKITGGPEVSARGSGIDDEALQAVLPRIVEALHGAAADGIDDQYTLQQMVRRVVGKWVNETYRRRPMILPVVVSV
jgi:ribonuclease J